MKCSRFTEEQIVGIPKKHEAKVPVAESGSTDSKNPTVPASNHR